MSHGKLLKSVEVGVQNCQKQALRPGLSDRIEIESYFVIESNRMQIESNDFFRFSIRFNSIRSGRKCDQENCEL
jgi:hypothetical protein